MTEFAAALVWSAIQITVFSGLVSLFILVGRNWISGICGDVLAISMGLILTFTLFAVIPIPSWFESGPQQLADNANVVPETKSTSSNAQRPTELADSPSPALDSMEGKQLETTPLTSEINVVLSKWWSEFQYTPSIEAEVREPERRFPWLWIVGGTLLVMVAIGLLKLTLGFVALKRLRSSAREVNDPHLSQLIRTMSEEIRVTRDVKVFESNEILTAATIGWLKPLILLPEEWKEWSESELSSAIAHELAHVSSNDFAYNLIAQFAVALNFFNPLVHWLGRELRVSQELVADEKAAAANGGRKTYLLTMAEMALKQDTNQLGWLAQPFLPTRTTFLRRIEMLKGNKQLRNYRGSLAMGIARLSLLGIAIACIGFRAPPTQPLNAQDSGTAGDRSVQDGAWDQLEFVADDTQLFFAADLEVLRKIEVTSHLLDKIDRLAGEDGSTFFYEIKKSKTITVQVSGSARNQQPNFGMVIRTLEPLPAIDKLDGTLFNYRDFQCIDTSGPCIHFKDSNTIVFGNRREVLQSMLDSPHGPQVSEWRTLVKRPDHQPIFVALSELGFSQLPLQIPPLNSGELDVFSPLWKDVRCFGAGIRFDDDSAALELLVHPKDPNESKSIQEAFGALMKISSNFLDTIKINRLRDHRRVQIGKKSIEKLSISDAASDQPNSSLTSGQFKVKTQITLEEWTEIVEFASEMILGGVEVEVSHSMNNIRMVALAMHNYEAAYGHFPAASIVAPGSKHPHSWRIAILPFMEYGDLYDKYRVNEPWNSEHNARITSEMPDVYRLAGDAKDSTHSGIYFLTGDRTPFPEGKEPELTDIVDGTANTILAVESDEDIHWAKPQDIEFDADDPKAAERLVEKLAGGNETFVAAFFDGSVRKLNRSIVDKLPLLIDPADKTPIDRPDPRE